MLMKMQMYLMSFKSLKIFIPTAKTSPQSMPSVSLPVQPGLMTHATLHPSTSAARFMVTWSALYPGVVSKQLWSPSSLLQPWSSSQVAQTAHTAPWVVFNWYVNFHDHKQVQNISKYYVTCRFWIQNNCKALITGFENKCYKLTMYSMLILANKAYTQLPGSIPQQ